MSSGKSDNVRFELQFAPDYAAELNAWRDAHEPERPLSAQVRQALQEYRDNRGPDAIRFSDDQLAMIDRFRAKSTPPHARQTIVDAALKEYMDKYDNP